MSFTPPDPAPTDTTDLRLYVNALDAESRWHHALARMLHHRGQTDAANQHRILGNEAGKLSSDTRRHYNQPENQLPVPAFLPEIGGTYTHAEGFRYCSVRVQERLGWVYTIEDTKVIVTEYDGGSSYGVMLMVSCLACPNFEHNPKTVGGPSQWPLEAALSAGMRHWRDTHA